MIPVGNQPQRDVFKGFFCDIAGKGVDRIGRVPDPLGVGKQFHAVPKALLSSVVQVR